MVGTSLAKVFTWQRAVARAGAAGQILTSAATVAAIGEGYSASRPYRLELKGIAEPLEVVEVDWR